MINIEINNTTDCSVNKKSVQRTVDKFDKFIDKLNFNPIVSDQELSIAFVSNKEIKKTNKIYRGIDKPTDVLSFGSLVKGGYAEIIISYEQAKKQAKDNKITIKQEVEKLLIHGLLHLVGYDHESEREAVEMEKVEGAILKKNFKFTILNFK